MFGYSSVKISGVLVNIFQGLVMNNKDIPQSGVPVLDHIRLTSHVMASPGSTPAINWYARDPVVRGPVIGTVSDPKSRNCIGCHSGSYSVYRALSIASGRQLLGHRPDLENTEPTEQVQLQPSWFEEGKIISLDPWGANITGAFNDFLAEGYNIQPSIAITQARLKMPEIQEAIASGRLPVDEKFVTSKGEVKVTKVAIDPVWYLPGLAERFGVSEAELRKILFRETGGMFPELVTRSDLKVLLPPIGSSTAYIFGSIGDLANSDVELTCRVHDECNGSDVFGSDICTCRPYLTYGIEQAVRTAQKGGVGLVVYYRKEGRALGEVTKFLVYNARKRQRGGDSAATYFARTECVAGVQDARFQELMPDVLHYFGIKKIHNLHSMSNMKYDAIVASGIEVVNRVSIPEEYIPDDARVEIEAKKAAGYFTEGEVKSSSALADVKGRALEVK
ncbi:GTP cyclohydrolase II [Microbulbifer bruguierae]|uniref:GTP cyclohydrolase II n=1 Tax=Microbulbifer bruguierae TaxID=3029061 RepID=A0ABY8NE50_9GAMM|nr:GTP cyclohydrolase II [Microbulbifer bruguierae]WGL17191.1 GTP cyclohydrolase II [Microbulbifer bruguierae]